MDQFKRRLQLTVDDAKGAARDAIETAQKAVRNKASESRVAANEKARGIGNKLLQNVRSNQERAAHQFRANVELLQRSVSDSASDLTDRLRSKAVEATSAANDRALSSVSESTAKLKRMSSSVVEVVDARARVSSQEQARDAWRCGHLPLRVRFGCTSCCSQVCTGKGKDRRKDHRDGCRCITKVTRIYYMELTGR
uniref:Uncharacterized protein n=1 Tax=Hyaloperonospora arabidopsidis (strain Emoy2) TaxID=559515 RepID=M4BV22_HYAAE